MICWMIMGMGVMPRRVPSVSVIGHRMHGWGTVRNSCSGDCSRWWLTPRLPVVWVCPFIWWKGLWVRPVVRVRPVWWRPHIMRCLTVVIVVSVVMMPMITISRFWARRVARLLSSRLMVGRCRRCWSGQSCRFIAANSMAFIESLGWLQRSIMM
jgi:hypothetical protein